MTSEIAMIIYFLFWWFLVSPIILSWITVEDRLCRKWTIYKCYTWKNEKFTTLTHVIKLIFFFPGLIICLIFEQIKKLFMKDLK